MHHLRSIFVAIIFFFMNKKLTKATMRMSKLRNNFLRCQSNENRKKFSKKRNYCFSLLRKVKKELQKNITDSKNFWKTVTPFLSDKVLSTKKITLTENDKIIKNDSEIASIMNTFFL